MPKTKSEALNLPVADGWQVREVDADCTAVVFTHGPERTGVILENDALSQFISHTLNAAARYASTHSPQLEDGQTVNAIPVPVSGLAHVPGRTPNESIVAVQLGQLTISLALPAASLLEFAARIVADTIPTERQPKH